MMGSWGKNRICKWRLYLASLLTVVFLGAILQLVTVPDVFAHPRITEWGRMLHLAIWVAFLLPMTAYAKRYIILLVVYVALFVSVAYVPFFAGMNVGGSEIATAYLLGASWFLFWTWMYGAAQKLNSHVVRRVVCGLAFALLALSTLMPLFVWGYWIVSGGYVLSSAIMLTLFQTNLNEAAAYLNSQNPRLWLLGLLGLLLVMAGIIRALRIVLRVDMQPLGRCATIVWLAFMAMGMFSVNQHVGNYLPVRIGMETLEGLQEYRAYGEARSMREERLKSLQGLHVVSSGGVFVLVIGESETRNHMQVYGYDRETTPWLQGQRENKENITFSHAYSNHTHTVPVLTYALSEKNQYNEMDLKDAYSIVEAANAAGYETYWISNQRKFGAWDTPVAEIGSTAQHQKWMNGRVGAALDTDYYDEILLSQIPEQCSENVLIVIHLMGCHWDYRDRYPKAYFSGENTLVDRYDDSVRYNDYILSQIYERVHSLPNFKGMIYFSDHGDDPDRGLGHDANKFTWTMARIPLMMWFSDEFQKERPETFAQLRGHEQAYWTNDLIYDVMLDLLGIEGMPHVDLQHDLASTDYAVAKGNALTLHGSRKVADEEDMQ